MVEVSWSERYIEAEVMDQPDLDTTEHRRALEHLQMFNRLSRIGSTIWPSIRKLAKKHATADRPLRVLDLACGGGDVLIDLARRAQKANLPCQWVGWDISPVSKTHGEELAARSKLDVTFEQHDVVEDEFPEGVDVVISTLFFHHLRTDTVVELLKKMSKAARHAVLVSDIIRARWHYALVKTVTTCFSSSWVVKVDGPISVRAAFTIDEFRQAVADAGLVDATVKPVFPGRFLLHWEKSEDDGPSP